MATRTRLPRKAAHTICYTAHDDPLDEDEEHFEEGDDEEEWGANKTSKGKKALKRRKVEVEESEEDEEESEAEDCDEQEGGQENKDKDKEPEYEVVRIDFSKTFPAELIAEIFRYLHPRTLYALSTLNKRLHNFFVGPAALSAWKNAFEVKEFPLFGGKEVDPRKLAALVFDKTCELCGKLDVECGDRYLLVRLCPKCRAQNWVKPSDIGAGKTYSDFHAAVLLCAIPTHLPPDDAFTGSIKKQFFYLSDLADHDEKLVHLQLLDDRTTDKARKEEPDAEEIQKQLNRASKLKRRAYLTYQLEQAQEIEEEVEEQFGLHVQEYIAARKKIKEERKKLANFISSKGPRDRWSGDPESFARMTFSGDTGRYRYDAIATKVAEAGVFKADDMSCVTSRSSKSFYKAEPMTDAIWEQVEPYINKMLGKEVANDMFNKRGRKKHAKMLTKPEDRSAEGVLASSSFPISISWALIKPTLSKLWSAHLKEKKAAEAKSAIASARLKKEPFFRERYDKIVAGRTTKAQAYLPRFDVFLLLPTVKNLFFHSDKYGTSGADNQDDIDAWPLDDVLEEIEQYILDVRSYALKRILAVSTSKTAKEIDDLINSEDALASTDFNDVFFGCPSSWMMCSSCKGQMVGPLPELLVHWQSHYFAIANLDPDKDEFVSPVDTSLEVSCAISEIVERAGLDESDGSVTKTELNNAFEDQKLVWENPPEGRTRRRRDNWTEVVAEISQAAVEQEKRGSCLDVPVIKAKPLNNRERWREQRNRMYRLYR
ncbi:hypothetical protein JCM8547_005785 [Rhodosporidiobolus lusitaniae]